MGGIGEAGVSGRHHHVFGGGCLVLHTDHHMWVFAKLQTASFTSSLMTPPIRTHPKSQTNEILWLDKNSQKMCIDFLEETISSATQLSRTV